MPGAAGLPFNFFRIPWIADCTSDGVFSWADREWAVAISMGRRGTLAAHNTTLCRGKHERHLEEDKQPHTA